MSTPITLENAQPCDLVAIQTCCAEVIQSTCISDYTPAQVAAWVAAVSHPERWRQAIATQFFLLAKRGNSLLGFGSLKDGYYIDFLFVHKDHQGQGVATLLYEHLKQESLQLGFASLVADVSHTARPFFRAKGFTVLHPNRKVLNGVVLLNYRMQQ